MTTEQKVLFDRLNSFEDCCKETGEDPLTAIPYATPKNDRERWLNFTAELEIIIRAHNNGWKGDALNSKQKRFFPVFDNLSGVGLSYLVYGYVNASTYVGSRLTSVDDETVKQLVTKFKPYFDNYLTK